MGGLTARTNDIIAFDGSRFTTWLDGNASGLSGAVLRGINLGLDARAMFVLEKPQDAFFRLTQGREERIPAG